MIPSQQSAITLHELHPSDYAQEQTTLHDLVDSIWQNPGRANAHVSLHNWSKGTETGTYFYIQNDQIPIGLTGYFIVDLDAGLFGLRHHGTTVKGTGKPALDLLLAHLRTQYGPKARRIIELLPEGRDDLIKKFCDWQFMLAPSVHGALLQQEYYAYMMERRI